MTSKPMIAVSDFGPALLTLLPLTAELLKAANLTVHPSVRKITLEGSRGLAGRYRSDSDIDLSLLMDTAQLPPAPDLGDFLNMVLRTTLDNWRGAIEADLAAVFDIHDCNLACFDKITADGVFCTIGGVDCCGVYKVQRGFKGFVPKMGVQMAKLYPCLTIWRNPDIPQSLAPNP